MTILIYVTLDPSTTITAPATEFVKIIAFPLRLVELRKKMALSRKFLKFFKKNFFELKKRKLQRENDISDAALGANFVNSL
jgi:hypothetical protein